MAFGTCGLCHHCLDPLVVGADDVERCPTCRTYREYVSHGFGALVVDVERCSPCPVHEVPTLNKVRLRRPAIRAARRDALALTRRQTTSETLPARAGGDRSPGRGADDGWPSSPRFFDPARATDVDQAGR